MKTLVQKGKGVAVCPEALGGLTLTHLKTEIIRGKGEDVLRGKSQTKNLRGENVSLEMTKGAQRTLRIAQKLKINTTILKEKTPPMDSEKFTQRAN